MEQKHLLDEEMRQRCVIPPQMSKPPCASTFVIAGKESQGCGEKS